MPSWQPAGITIQQLRSGAFTLVELAEQALILTLAEGRPVAFRRYCPHASADLSQGDLHRSRVTCPQHGYKFDMRSGRILYPSDESYRLRCYSLELRGDEIWVDLG